MSSNRFYHREIGTTKRLVVHDKALLHQWCNVLRLKLGDSVTLFDGAGQEVTYQVTALSKRRAELVRQAINEVELPNRDIWLAWSLLKRENNELVVQKATELGVTQLVPVIAERCIRSHISQTRSGRWQKIMTEAAEQCGRGDVPKLSKARTLAAVMQLKQPKDIVVCRQTVLNQSVQSKTNSPTLVLVGPEGGWSPAEEKLFDSHQLASLQLSQFTLRAETAAIAAIVAVTATR